MGAITHVQASLRGDPAALEIADLANEGEGIDHETIADDANFAGIEHARGDQVQDVPLGADFDRVSGVATALVADHDLRVTTEKIHDLSLALIAPLGSYQQCIRHLAKSFPTSAKTGSGCSTEGRAGQAEGFVKKQGLENDGGVS